MSPLLNRPWLHSPVTVCGLPIEPGDLLHGDENGLPKEPEEGRDRLLDATKDVKDAEMAILAYLASDGFTIKGLQERLMAGSDWLQTFDFGFLFSYFGGTGE